MRPWRRLRSWWRYRTVEAFYVNGRKVSRQEFVDAIRSKPEEPT